MHQSGLWRPRPPSSFTGLWQRDLDRQRSPTPHRINLGNLPQRSQIRSENAELRRSDRHRSDIPPSRQRTRWTAATLPRPRLTSTYHRGLALRTESSRDVSALDNLHTAHSALGRRFPHAPARRIASRRLSDVVSISVHHIGTDKAFAHLQGWAGND